MEVYLGRMRLKWVSVTRYREKTFAAKVSKLPKNGHASQCGVERNSRCQLPGSATFSHRPNYGFRVDHTKALGDDQQEDSHFDCRAKTNNTNETKSQQPPPHRTYNTSPTPGYYVQLVGRLHPGYKSISYSRLQSNLVRPRLDVGVDVQRIYERRPKSLRLPCLVQTL